LPVQKALPLVKDGSSIVLNASMAGSKGMPGFVNGAELFVDGGMAQV
jgi:hypothetical protein